MRYASIRKLDISNGEGIGISLFVQGCPFHCKNCFNSETWDFNGGKEWNKNVSVIFLELLNRNYIRRVSILGGEPFSDQNVSEVESLVQEIRNNFSDKKTIWIYSGYKWEDIWTGENANSYNRKRQHILQLCDVFIDGQYIDGLRDLKLHWRGSSNQRVIDTKKTLQTGEIVLWMT